MIAQDFADLAQARRKSKNEWVANCPAHEDRHESLSICNGIDGVVEFRCSEGCTIDDIMEDLALDWDEVFSRPAPGPNVFEMSALEQAEFNRKKAERQLAHAAACDRVRELQRIADELQSRLEKMRVGIERTKMVQRYLKVEGKLRRAEKEEVGLRG